MKNIETLGLQYGELPTHTQNVGQKLPDKRFTTWSVNLASHYMNGKLSASGKKRFNSIKSPARKLNQTAASTGAVER